MAASANDRYHYAFQKDAVGMFLRVCFFPGAALKTREHCKFIIGLNGAHLKRDGQTWGLPRGDYENYNEHDLVFDLAFLSVENFDNSEWCLGHLKAATFRLRTPFASSSFGSPEGTN